MCSGGSVVQLEGGVSSMARSSSFRRRQFQIRTAIALLLGALWTLWLIWRVTDIQVLHNGVYAAMAHAEDVHTFTLASPRGAILDANGHVLAMDEPAYTVTAAPRVIEEAAKAARDPGLLDQEAKLLHQELPYPTAELRRALSGRAWYRLIDPYVGVAAGQALLNEAGRLPGITV